MGLSNMEYDHLRAEVRKVGAEHGAARGSWVISGNTPKESAQRILQGIEDGDPEVLDALPQLSMGEWADDPTQNDIVSEAAYRGRVPVDPADLDPELMDELISDYQTAWDEGMTNEVERDARSAAA